MCTMLSLLFAACAQPADSPVDTSSKVEAVPYIYDDTDSATPAFTAEEVGGFVDAALASVWTVSAAPVFPAYHAAMEAADTSCPNYYDYNGSQYWYDDCTAESGAAFNGYAFDYVYADYSYDGYVLDGEAIYGVGSTTDADGATLQFGGSATFYTTAPEGLAEDDPDYFLQVSNQIQGGFTYDGESAAGTWLGDGQAPDLVTYTYWVPSYDGRYAYADGAVTVDGGQPVVFETLALYSANLRPDCPDEPYGGVSVRDDAGEWYDVVYQGPEQWDTEVDADLCDSCGEVYFHGQDLGKACSDFGTFTDWEVSPWT